MTIEEKEQEIIDEFSIYDDWMDKYAYLIERLIILVIKVTTGTI